MVLQAVCFMEQLLCLFAFQAILCFEFPSTHGNDRGALKYSQVLQVLGSYVRIFLLAFVMTCALQYLATALVPFYGVLDSLSS
jgi:hypothetical protein